MSTAINDIESYRAQLRPNLANYLTSKGVKLAGNNMFCCIAPGHNDEHPSCGIVPESNGRYFHCFTCGISGDIFKAATFLENKPEDGPGFITENVFYIGKMYGQEPPSVDLSEEDYREAKIRQAYSDAAFIIVKSTPSPVVAAKLADYAWKAPIQSLGIGGIESHAEFIKKLMMHGNYSKEFLAEVDLDNRNIFNPDCLIYTVRDEKGFPVGFAARNLRYDAKKKEAQAIAAKFGENSPEAKAAKKGVPAKYYNSTEHDPTDSTKIKNPIYQKSKRLFGFHIARKHGNPLFVFEGYSDCATAHNYGLTNSCAIGATAFTKDHLNMILGMDYKQYSTIRHVIFCLDADAAGNTGTERFMKLVDEVLGGNVGFTVEILSLPPGSDDPDAFIRKNGLAAFTSLPRTTVLQWRMGKALDAGEQPSSIAEKMARLIVNESSPPVRFDLSKQVGAKLDMPAEVIYDMVKMLVDEDRQKLEAQRNVIAQHAVKLLQKDPSRVSDIMEQTSLQLESLESSMAGYNPKMIADAIRYSRTVAKSSLGAKRLVTGWPIFDEKFGGIPVSEAFIAIPGKPNQAKTSLMVNIFWRTIQNNPEAICFYHTMDDALSVFLPRVLGSRSKIPSLYYQDTAEYLEKLKANQQFGILEEGEAWLEKMLESQRLGAADSSVLPRDIGALSTYIRDIRRQFPSRPIIIFADNFAHYDIRSGAPSEGEGRTQYIARYAKDLTIKYRCTALMTMELPKDSLRPGVRPRAATIKGTSSIAYEASANIGVYNDLKDYGPKATLFWEDKKDTELYTGPTGEILTRPIKKPVIELVFDKSKIFKGFDGVIYYHLDPMSGHFEECSPQLQTMYQQDALIPKEDDFKPTWGNGNGGGNSSGPAKPWTPTKPKLLQPAPSAFSTDDDDSWMN